MNGRFLKASLPGVILFFLARTTFGIADDVTKDGDIAALESGQTVEFSFITPLGWVRFSVSADWAESSMQTKGPIKAAAFTISGDPASGNLVALGVILYQIDSPQASAVYSASHDKAIGAKSRLGAWEIVTSERKRGDTTYTIRTAFRDIADVHVSVRLASPSSSKMEQTFTNLLKSFSGEVGSYQRRQEEKIRRPD